MVVVYRVFNRRTYIETFWSNTWEHIMLQCSDCEWHVPRNGYDIH